MNENEKMEWTAPEYEEKYRSQDWFWALGVIVVAGSAASLIYGNYFFSVLIVLAGVLLGFYAVKKPDIISYELNNKGVRIRTRFYPYENIKSFWIQKSEEAEAGGGREKPILFIKSERAFMPVIALPIDDAWAEDIRSIMLAKDLPEEKMKEHASEKIMEFLGF